MSTLNNDNEYKPRLLDKIIDEYLENCGATCSETSFKLIIVKFEGEI